MQGFGGAAPDKFLWYAKRQMVVSKATSKCHRPVCEQSKQIWLEAL
jgi:hypothetical protein